MHPHNLEDSPLVALARIIAETCHIDDKRRAAIDPAQVAKGLGPTSSLIGTEALPDPLRTKCQEQR